MGLVCWGGLCVPDAPAAGWETLGTEGFVTNITDPKYVADNGAVYVAFTEAAVGHRATVMTFSGGNWVDVGANPFTPGAAYWPSLAIHDGVPYLAFQDDTQGGKLTVMRSDGVGGWETVGAAGFSTGLAIYTSLAFNGDIPYVAYRDQAEGDRVCVRHFVAGSWQLVGAAGFSNDLIHYTSLAIYDNEPYVAFRDQGVLGGRARVMRFTGGAWQDVGAAAVSEGSASYLSLAFSGGEPYVAYQDNANDQRATLMRFTAGSWTPVGGIGFTIGRVDHLSLGFIGAEPYLSFMDDEIDRKITLMRYTGGAWEAVGAPGISDGQGTHTSFFEIDGEPYVGFRDAVHTNGATVRYYVFTTVPTVTTAAVDEITPTSVTAGGEVTDDGGGVVTARGVCWSTDAGPDINDTKTVDGGGVGVFESAVAGLSPNTDYFLRAYATNEEGTSYGDEVTFTTAIAPPTVTTADVTEITMTGATCGGTVTADGGDAVTARGVCWSTEETPEIGDDHTTDGAGLGAFVSTVTGLDPNTVYYVRAYATNGGGTGYGAQRSFTTQQSPPEVRTLPVVEITGHSGTARGEVTSTGGAPVTERGFCIGTEVNPTLDGYHRSVREGPGQFSITFGGLQAETTYYVRAYAINAIGTTYGGMESFTTHEGLPAVYTLPIQPPAQGVVVLRGRVIDEGGGAVSARGFCWSPAPNPTCEDDHIWLDGGSGEFLHELEAWEPNATYHVRSMAQNSTGVAYGNQVTFATPVVLPSVATIELRDVTSTSARVAGRVLASGGGTVADRGICFGPGEDPTIADEHVSVGPGSGLFEATIQGLVPGRSYWVRAYAVNEAGAAYGASLAVVTGAVVPVVTTGEVSGIGDGEARATAIVIDEGGAAVHTRGFCWSLDDPPTLQGSHLTAGAGAGTYEAHLTGLLPGKIYYLRAYATNDVGTGFGETHAFETDPVLPTVTTSPMQPSSLGSAMGGGEVIDTGGGHVTARGLCWSSEPLPTRADAHVSAGAGGGVFVARLSGLTPRRVYYARAYATNPAGTAYGEQVTFCPAADLPSVAGVELASSGVTQVAVRSQVLGDGGTPITARGVCWREGGEPTLEGPHEEVRGGVGSFVAALTGLEFSTRYYLRAFATNAVGTAYGPVSVFTTETAVPSVTTAQATNVTSTSARVYGMVVSDGGSRITERGVCWNESGAPTTDDDRTAHDGDLGRYHCQLDGLTPGVRYYVRCYAVNRAGVGYGEELTFQAPAGLARVRTGAVRDVTWNAALCEGEVLSVGGAPLLERGVCWGVTSEPTLADEHTAASGSLGAFTVEISGLKPAGSYFARVYATTTVGTVYGDPVSFATPARLAGVGSVAVQEVGDTSVSLWLGACDDGGASIQDRGVCWEAVSVTWPARDCHACGSGSDSVELSLTGLRPNTEYVARGYAQNAVGTAYGPPTTFRTRMATPEVMTEEISDVGARSARCAGRLHDAGGGEVTSYGVCWSHTDEPTVEGPHLVISAPLAQGAGFEVTIPDLMPATGYLIRSFAVNDLGVGYSVADSFRTQMALPVVVTTARAEVEATSARVGGLVLEEGGGQVRRRGVCWSETGQPSVEGPALDCGDGPGAFVAEVDGLRPVTRYRMRAFATNEVGSAYGEEIVVLTPMGLPSIGSMSVTANSATSARAHVRITSGGGGQVTERGVCWSTRPAPTVADSSLIAGGDLGTFTVEISGLEPGVTYHVRPYAMNSAGTVYGTAIEVSCWETRIHAVGPNPFAASARIEYTVSRPVPVSVEIFDLSGRRVRVLRDEPAESGKHTIVWDGRLATGTPAGSGVYFLRLQAAGSEDRRSIILLR